MLWSIFEMQKLFGDGRIAAMISYVDELAKFAEADQRKLLTAPFIPHLAYFRDQFVDIEQGTVNEAFDAIKFESEQQKQLVSHALIKLNDETPELIKALLIIVHHIRDSLFRGLRWRHCGRKQRDDLYHASKILMKATDISTP